MSFHATLYLIGYMCSIAVFLMLLTSDARKNPRKGRDVLEKNAILLTVCILTPIVNTVWCVMYMIAAIADYLEKKLPGREFSLSALEAWYRKWFAKIFI